MDFMVRVDNVTTNHYAVLGIGQYRVKLFGRMSPMAQICHCSGYMSAVNSVLFSTINTRVTQQQPKCSHYSITYSPCPNMS